MRENGKTSPPSWMNGIKQGEWQQISKAQLRSKQRPCYPLKTRVWSTLILHSAGYQSEIAVQMKNGERIPVTAADIASELQRVAAKYYHEAAIREQLTDTTREKVRRCLVDLESDGLCQRDINHRIHVWLIPKLPKPARIKKQWREAKAADPQMEFQFNQLFRAFHLPLPKKSQSSDPAYQKTVERAFESARKQFLEVLSESKSDRIENLIQPSPFIPQVVLSIPRPPVEEAPRPPVEGALYKEENKVENKEQQHHPPGVETTTGRRMRMPLESQYPLTLKTLRSKDPAVTEAFLQRLVTETVEHCRHDPTFPETELPKLTDKVFAAMVRESFRTGPKNHGIGLLLSRVPAIAVTWSQDEPIRRNEQRRA